ncbi:MAG: hypothetical protein V4547_13825 [Bacteroidota bacterium]
MIFIDLENSHPTDDWINRADAITQQLINALDHDARKVIINANQALWTELKEHLCNLRNRKCWYSESVNDGAHCHVDHFRPKTNALDENGDNQGGYWWLAFDWMNYRYSGPAPNIRKKDYFPVLQNKANAYAANTSLEDILLLDPIIIGDPAKLGFDIEGKVIPKSQDNTTRDYKRAVYSIEKYNLNSEGLKEGRRQKQINASKLINQSQKLIALQAVNHDQARESDIMRIWKELRNLAHPDSEYSATVKYCLKSCGQDWALEIAMAA